MTTLMPQGNTVTLRGAELSGEKPTFCGTKTVKQSGLGIDQVSHRLGQGCPPNVICSRRQMFRVLDNIPVSLEDGS